MKLLDTIVGDHIPDDIIDAATRVINGFPAKVGMRPDQWQQVHRAICDGLFSERERCAKLAEKSPGTTSGAIADIIRGER